MDAIRIELISNTCKAFVLPLNYASLIGPIGIEPITFRYERNILPLNYGFIGIIGFEPILMESKSNALPFGYIPKNGPR